MVMELDAPAKVNLYLGVHREKDARGYHRVDSVMVPLGLCDVVRIEPAEALRVVMAPDPGVPQEENTAYRAASLLAEASGREARVRIEITKRIPAQSGLGGSAPVSAS